MDKEKIFEFVYLMAFRDATMRRAFPKKTEESEEEYKNRKNNSFLKAKGPARKFIDKLLAGSDDIEPETYMLEICRAVKTYGFTFGNAQKLINMLSKYMYIICYEDETKRKLFKNCHCPMDGGMISLLSKDKSFHVPPEFSWSRMNTTDNTIHLEYKAFQKKISEKCNDDMYAIEYDYNNW